MRSARWRQGALWTLLALIILEVPATETDAAWLVRGVVRDAETGQGIAHATLGVGAAGAAVATADSTGRFRVSLEAFPVVVVAEAAGYRPRRIPLASAPSDELEVVLRPDPYEMAETLVQYEDPAVRIMREVIRRKRVWRARGRGGP